VQLSESSQAYLIRKKVLILEKILYDKNETNFPNKNEGSAFNK